MRQRGRRARRERGSMAVELSILGPLVLVLLFFVVAAGRFVNTSQTLNSTARDAARFASQARTVGEARQVVAKINEGLASGGYGDLAKSCRGSLNSGSSDFSAFKAGGSVTVIFSCNLSYDDLFRLGLPGSVTMRGKAISAIDPYRGVR